MISRIDPKVAKTFAVNIRYLCWKRNRDRNLWPGLLASWLRETDSLEVALSLLTEARPPKPEHIESIARELNLDEQELVFTDMAIGEGVSLLKCNLERLLSSPGKLSKGDLAREVGVSPATLSRWISGVQVPDTKARRMIANLFGLRGEDELVNVPLFLSYQPLTYGEQIAWLNKCLQEIDENELFELFPALSRIFSTVNERTLDQLQDSKKSKQIFGLIS